MKKNPAQRKSRSGRVYKPTQGEDKSLLYCKIVHSLDYDDELKILAVLYTRVNKSRQEKDHYVIGLYDNENGEEIRCIELQQAVSDKDDHEWNLFFNDYLLICTLKHFGARGTTTVFIYQMFENT